MRMGLHGFYCAAATLAADGSISYTNGTQMSEAVKCSCTPDIAEGEYSSNNKTHKHRKLRGVNLALECNTLSFAIRAMMFGHANNTADGVNELTITGADTPAHIGLTHYCEDTNGKWYGTFHRYVQFAPPAAEDNTAGNNLAFGSTTLNGYAELTGDGLACSLEKEFATEAAALAWCKTQVGISTT